MANTSMRTLMKSLFNGSHKKRSIWSVSTLGATGHVLLWLAGLLIIASGYELLTRIGSYQSVPELERPLAMLAT